jgi:hypothetical protein
MQPGLCSTNQKLWNSIYGRTKFFFVARRSFIKPAPPVSDRAKSFSFSYIFVIPSIIFFFNIIFHQTLIEAMKTQKRMRKSPDRRRSRKVDPTACFYCWFKKRSVSNYLGKIAFAKYHHLQTKLLTFVKCTRDPDFKSCCRGCQREPDFQGNGPAKDAKRFPDSGKCLYFMIRVYSC